MDDVVVVLGAHPFPVEGARVVDLRRLAAWPRRLPAGRPRRPVSRDGGCRRLPRGRPAALARRDRAGDRGVARRRGCRRRRELRWSTWTSRLPRPGSVGPTFPTTADGRSDRCSSPATTSGLPTTSTPQTTCAGSRGSLATTDLPPIETDVGPTPGSALAAARARRRLTVEEAAARADLDPETVRALEEARVYRFETPQDAIAAVIVYANGLGISKREARELVGLPVRPRLLDAVVSARFLAALVFLGAVGAGRLVRRDVERRRRRRGASRSDDPGPVDHDDGCRAAGAVADRGRRLQRLEPSRCGDADLERGRRSRLPRSARSRMRPGRTTPKHGSTSRRAGRRSARGWRHSSASRRPRCPAATTRTGSSSSSARAEGHAGRTLPAPRPRQTVGVRRASSRSLSPSGIGSSQHSRTYRRSDSSKR